MSQPGNSDYRRRKEAGICTYPGCPRSASDESSMCRWHHKRQRKRARLSAERIREERRSKGACIYCGKPAKRNSYACHAHLVFIDRTGAKVVEKSVDKFRRRKKERDARMASRTEVDRDGRERYRGQSRRGRRLLVTEIREGLGDCRKLLGQCDDAVEYYESAEVQVLPRIQKDEVMRAGLSYLHLLWRIAGETLKLGGYELEVEQINDDDDEEIDEPAVASGR